MQALTFWKTVTMDQANLLERLIGLLGEQRVRYCVIGGQATASFMGLEPGGPFIYERVMGVGCERRS